MNTLKIYRILQVSFYWLQVYAAPLSAKNVTKLTIAN